MEERVAHCQLIASVLAADGMMQDDEKHFLERAMTKMGLSDEEREKVISFKDSENAAAALRGLAKEERQKIVDDLVRAALVDGKLSPHETEMVGKIREALGL